MKVQNGNVTITQIPGGDVELKEAGDIITLEVQGIPVKYTIISIDWNKNMMEVQPAEQ